MHLLSVDANGTALFDQFAVNAALGPSYLDGIGSFPDGSAFISARRAEDTLEVRRFTADGIQTWSRSILPPMPDAPWFTVHAGFAQEDGGILLANNSVLIKLDSSGELVFAKSYHTIAQDTSGSGEPTEFRICAITSTSDGGAIMADRLTGNLIRCDGMGVPVWTEQLSMNLFVHIRALAQTPDGGFLVCGQGDHVPLVVKLNADGAIDWARSYAYEQDNFDIIDACVSPDGDVMFRTGIPWPGPILMHADSDGFPTQGFRSISTTAGLQVRVVSMNGTLARIAGTVSDGAWWSTEFEGSLDTSSPEDCAFSSATITGSTAFVSIDTLDAQTNNVGITCPLATLATAPGTDASTNACDLLVGIPTVTGDARALQVTPTVVVPGAEIRLVGKNEVNYDCSITDQTGRSLVRFSFAGEYRILTTSLSSGVYFINAMGARKAESLRFIIQ